MTKKETPKNLMICNSTAEFLIFTNQAGKGGIEVRYEEESIWLTQKLMAELFDVSIPTVNEHLKNIFESGELQQDSVIRKFLTTAADGKNYNTNFYNLDVIISVGYRVNSVRATQFRQWATHVLREFAVKGYVLDKKRLENGTFLGKDYFERLLSEIREIRLSERRFYQKITDIYVTSVDYNKDAPTTRAFFAKVQNKLHYAIHGHTAAELIKKRADSSKPHMGLTSWEAAPSGKIIKPDVAIAKNYLTADEIESLGRIVNAYLDLAEDRAKRKIPMTMEDWAKRLDQFLEFNERDVLPNAGSISADLAKTHAESEFEKYRVVQDQLFVSDFDKEIKAIVAPKAAEKESSGGKKDEEEEMKILSLSELKLSLIDGDRGKNYPQSNDFSPAGDCLFLSAKNVTNNGFKFEDTQFISQAKDNRMSKGKLKRNDIVITTRGTVGNAAWYNDDVIYESIRINSGMVIIRNEDESLDTEFLYKTFKSEITGKQIDRLVYGSAQPQLTLDLIGQIEIHFPILSEQKKIASILGTWDEAIEKLRQYLGLKEKAWRAFRTQALASLAKKYGSLPIGECSERIVGGGTPSRDNASYWGGTIPWVSVKDMIASVLSDTQEHITATALKESASNIIPAFTPIIATRMAVGRMAYFTVDVAINQDLKAVIPTENFEALYIFHCLKALEGKIAALGTGSTVAGVTLDVIREQVIPTPPKKIQAKFVALADCHEKEIVTIQKQIALIQSQKRGLMQKLLTGAWQVTSSKEAAA